MSSPFDAFRRHQKVAMVVLVFMAMFAFIVLDAVQKMNQMPTIVVAGAIGLLFAGVFWFLGNQRGEGKQYAILGAIIGTCAGFIGPQLNRPAAAVTTTFGRMTEKDVYEAIQSRNIANRFLQQASFQIEENYRKANPDSKTPPPRVQPQFFFSLFDRPPAEDVALGSVFLHEADRMGIKVSNATVTEYIKQATDKKLRKADFQEVLRQVGVDEATLYDAMRQEIRTKLAFQQLEPRTLMVPTPDDYWQLYRRLHVREQLEVSALSVGAFAKEVETPSDAQLLEFFSKYAHVQPTSAVSAEPAFGTPRQVRIAWIKADIGPADKAAAAEVDREIAEAKEKGLPDPIAAYYEKNKERYRNRFIPDRKPATSKPADGPLIPGFEPEKPDVKPSDDKKPDDAKPEDKTKDDKPKDDKPKDDKPEGDKKPEEKKPEGDKKADSEKPNGGECGRELALNDAAEDNAEAAEPKKDEKAADDKPAEKKADETKPAETPESPKTGDTLDAPKADEAPATAEIPGEPLEEDIPEFKPLDDLLRDEIRQELINGRAREALRKEMAAAKTKVEELYNKYNEESIELKKGEKRKFTFQMLSDQIAEWAKEHGLEYVASKFVSYEQLTTPDEYPIGLAGEADAISFQRRTVAEQVFASQRLPHYFPSVSTDLTGDFYTWWVIDEKPASVSDFKQEGMREKVLEAWKMKEAREPAEKRAKELVAKIKAAGDKPLTEVLANETVTGKSDSVQLTVHDTPSFSWLRSSQVPSMRGFDMPRLSSIPFVTNADAEFMRTVFDDLKPGEVGAVPNGDKSAWYIVKVKEREPSTAVGEEELRKQFLESRVDADPTFQILLYQERMALRQKWMDSVFTRYQVDLQNLHAEAPPRRGRR